MGVVHGDDGVESSQAIELEVVGLWVLDEEQPIGYTWDALERTWWHIG